MNRKSILLFTISFALLLLVNTVGATATTSLKSTNTRAVSATLLSENFESVTPTALPTGWTTENNLATPEWASEFIIGGQSAQVTSDGVNDIDAWLFTPAIALEAGKNYTLNFDSYFEFSMTNQDELAVSIGSSPNSSSMGVPIFDVASADIDEMFDTGIWKERTVNFSPTTTGNYYIGFRATAPNFIIDPFLGSDFFTIGIDSVTVSTPTNISLSLSTNSVTEGSGNTVTVTATAASALTYAEFLDVNVFGSLSLDYSDYTLSQNSIQIAAGQTQGSVTFTVNDDCIFEGNETATIEISSFFPTNNINIVTPSQNLTIVDDETSSVLSSTANDLQSLRDGINCYNNLSTPNTFTINITDDIHLNPSMIPSGTSGDFTDNELIIDNYLDPNAKLVINGNGHYISGDNTDRVMRLMIANVTINDLTIKDGKAPGDGAGILAEYITNLTINNSTIENNTSDLRNSTFFTAPSRGGGVFSLGNLFINNSTISQNSGEEGGAIYIGGLGTINNSTITLNNAIQNGGGISNQGLLSINNSIVAGNSSTNTIDNDLYTLFSSGINTIGSNNLIGDPSSSNSYGLTNGVNGNIVGQGGNPIPIASILDTTLKNNGGKTKTHALVSGSLALDAANPSVCTNASTVNSLDQRGVNRTPPCDIGAYEVLTVNIGNGSYSQQENGSSVSVTVTLDQPAIGVETVDYATNDGNALAGSDYVQQTGTISFANGEQSKTITISINNDADVEQDESFGISISNPSNLVLGTQSTSTVTITNDDSYRVYIPIVIK